MLNNHIISYHRRRRKGYVQWRGVVATNLVTATFEVGTAGGRRAFAIWRLQDISHQPSMRKV